MTKRWLWLIGLLVLAVLPARAQMTAVSASVQDANGQHYVNCSWSVVFVGQNTIPGAGPYQPQALLVGQQGECDSSGNLRVTLADNVRTITPTPSQWNFSICSAPGYVPGGTFCRSNMLVTITGQAQDLTAFFQPLMPLLPPGGGGGGGTQYITDATPLMGLMRTGTTLGLQTTCVAGQYLGWNGAAWACTGAGVGGGTTVTVNGTAAIPNILNFNNTSPLPPAGSQNVTFQLNGNSVSGYVPAGGGGTGFTVNGTTPTGTVNFNNSLPIPPPFGLNVMWQMQSGQLSAAVVGNGNAGDCFRGNGQFVPCPTGGGGGATLPTTPQYDLFASTGAGAAQASGVAATLGFLRAQVLESTGNTAPSAPGGFTPPNGSIEYFPTGAYGIGGAAGLAIHFSHSGSTTNGGIALGGGNATGVGTSYQIYLDCEASPLGCDFKVPVTVNGGSIAGGSAVTSINGSPGAFTFTGAVSCSGTNCAFSGTPGGLTGVVANSGLVQNGSLVGLITTCSANQYLSWTGTLWQCATPTGGVTAGTVNAVAKYATTTTVGPSLLSDNGTTLTYTGTGGIAVSGASGAGITMTGTGGTLTPVTGQGGIGIGPGGVPQYSVSGGPYQNIGSGGGGGATLPTTTAWDLFASTGSGGAQASGVLGELGFINAGASIVHGTSSGSPFTGANGSQEWYGAGGAIGTITVPNGAVLFMGNSASTAGATGNGGVVLGGNSASTPTSKEVYVDCEHIGCNFNVPLKQTIGGGNSAIALSTTTTPQCVAQNTPTASAQLSITVSTVAGDTLLVALAIPGVISASSLDTWQVHDSGGSTYTRLGNLGISGPLSSVDLRSTSASGAVPSTSVTITGPPSGTNATAKYVACVVAYKGVGGFGATNTNSSSANTSPITVSVTSTAANSVIVSAFSLGGVQTTSQGSAGTRLAGAASVTGAPTVAGSICANTSAAAATAVPCTLVPSTNANYTAIAQELLPGNLPVTTTIPHVIATGPITYSDSASISTPVQLCSNTTCPAGLYRMSYYANVSTACAGGTLTINQEYTDSVGAKTVALNSTAFAFSTATASSSGARMFQSTGAAAITYTTTSVACTTPPGGGTFWLTLEQLQ